MSTIAAIDVGSNAIRMIVGRLYTDGTLETLESLRLPVRLGQDAFTTGRFSEQTMQNAVGAFLRFRTVAQMFEASQVRAVATSAMRETENRDLLVQRIAQETGITIEIISGEEEARLVHMAVKQAVDLHEKTALLIDIGGGSVEVLLSDGENILSTESFKMGTVRLLRKLEGRGERQEALNQLLREYAASARRYIDWEIGNDRVDVCVGSGGNIEEMGRLCKRLLRRRRSDRIQAGDLDRLIERLGGMSVEERIQKVGLNPDRADVILPAMIVLQMVVREARVREVLVPGVGLKDGVLLDMAPQAMGPSLPRRVQVLASAERMGRKFGYDAEHAILTARLAASLYQQTAGLHGLPADAGVLLEAAAMLHDIGHYVNTIGHEQHGYYLIHHHPLIGLTPDEQEVVANLVRYHRKQGPAAADENLQDISPGDFMLLKRLSPLLRLADALDVSHVARVREVVIERVRSGEWRLKLVGEGEMMLEKWSLAKRKTLFEEVFGVSLEVETS